MGGNNNPNQNRNQHDEGATPPEQTTPPTVQGPKKVPLATMYKPMGDSVWNKINVPMADIGIYLAKGWKKDRPSGKII